jgi:hypothetical protein
MLRVALFTALVLPPPLLQLSARAGVVPVGTALHLLPWTGLAALLTFAVSGPLLYRNLGPSSDPSSDEDGGGNGGSGRDHPPSRPTPPRGGIPLPDADQARTRVRDHNRPQRARPTRRRVREPDRVPARTVLER